MTKGPAKALTLLDLSAIFDTNDHTILLDGLYILWYQQSASPVIQLPFIRLQHPIIHENITKKLSPVHANTQ